VTCDQPADQRFFLPEPRLIVEVLSRSTAAHDRGRKGEEYRRMLERIIEAARHRVWVEAERRDRGVALARPTRL
jgi:hypothetical protein